MGEVKVCFYVVVAQVALEEVFWLHVVCYLRKMSAPDRFPLLLFLYTAEETNLLKLSC